MAKKVKFMLGMMLGTAFGMAFAPKKGKELRKELVKDLQTGKGKKFIEHNAKAVGKDVADTAKEVYTSKEVQSKLNEGKQQVTKVAKKVEAQIKARTGQWSELVRENLDDYLGEEQVEKIVKTAKKLLPKKAAPAAAKSFKKPVAKKNAPKKKKK